MQATSNYGLRLPEETDYFDIGDFNYNFNTLDEAVKKAAEGSGDITDKISANTLNIIALELELSTLTSSTVEGTTDNVVIETFADNNDITITHGEYDSENHRVWA